MATKPKIQKSWKTDLLSKAKKNPDWWIENVLGNTLWSKQKEICRAIVDHERVAVPAAFGLGKTFLAARIALWFLYNHSPCRVITTAPCYDDQTEILTDEGWKLFKDLTKEEKVASLEDGELRFVTPEDWMDYNVEGEMIGYQGRDVDFLITPHHKCYMKKLGKNKQFELIKAEDAYGKWDWRFNRDLNWVGEDDPFGFTEKHYECLGVWFGDGSAGYKPERRVYQVTITQSKYPEYVEDLMSVFSDNVKKDVKSKPEDKAHWLDGYNFVIYSKELTRFFIQNFGRLKQDRKIPKWLKNAPPAKLKAFIKGFIMADGRFAKDSNDTMGARVYGNKQLADDLQEVGLRAGYVTNLHHRKKKLVKAGKGIEDEYALTFLSEIKSKKYPGSNRKHWYKKEYKGHVYCVKVPSGVVLVRRNGVYHWSGNTGRQVKDLLWAELRTAHGKSKVKLGGQPLTLKLQLATNRFAIGFSTEENNMDMFTGYHAANQLVVFDQAGGLPKMFWEATEGLMTSENCRWLAISNTAIADGDFADICMPERTSKRGTWKIIPIKATETPNVLAGRNVFPGLISYDWVEKRKEQWGEQDPMYRIFVEAEFVPTVEMTVIPYNLLVDSYARIGDADEDEIEVGLDVARSGLDSTVWFARCGERALELKRVNGNDTMQVAGETIEFIRKLERKYEKPVRVVKIDVIGVGAGVYDRLAEQDLPVLPINNSEVKIVADKERFSNVRAEMAWAFRDRFESGRVGLKNLKRFGEMFDSLQGDLQVIKYKITSSGKIQIQSKDEIKKKLGRSPDFWDAAVMAYEEPGGGPAMVEFMSSVDQKLIPDEEWLTLIGENVSLDDPSFVELERY